MPGQSVVVAARGMWYAPIGTARPTVSSITPNFTGAGWTKYEDLSEEGIELEPAYEAIEKRPLGTARPTAVHFQNRGIASIKFTSYKSDVDTIELAIPDGQYSGTKLSGGGTVQERQVALLTDNAVWWFKKTVALGALAETWNNEDFTTTPFELTCLELDSETAGTSNFEVEPLP